MKVQKNFAHVFDPEIIQARNEIKGRGNVMDYWFSNFTNSL